MALKSRSYIDLSTMCNKVTGSCHLGDINFPNGRDMKFIVDCGLYQEKEDAEKNKNFIFDPKDIEFCIVTHNHVDHTGRLPLLIKQGFDGKIYTTEDTEVLLPLALQDSYKVLKDIAKRRHSPQLYSEADVGKAVEKITPCIYQRTQKINQYVQITFFNNGHLIGAGVVLVQISYPGENSINILYTGDYNNKNIFLTLKQLPIWVKKLRLTVVIESTYGDMDSSERHECFAENILRCIHSNGTVVAPVFSLGRFQEILYEIKELQRMNELDPQIPVRGDGKLGIRYTKLFSDGKLHIKQNMVDFLPENLTWVDKSNRESILKSQEPQIILTTSGMGSYGPAQLYIPEYIKRPGALIHFTGYTAPTTLGGKLKQAAIGDFVNINGIVIPKKADVEYTNEFSAHAKANELIDFLKQFSNLELVLVTHGETEVKEKFAKRVMKEVKTKNVGILDGKHTFRINSSGLVKILNSEYV